MQDELLLRLRFYVGILLTGGTVFVLERGVRRSGLDEIPWPIKDRDNACFYAGYSAGARVLRPASRSFDFVDPPKIFHKSRVVSAKNRANGKIAVPRQRFLTSEDAVPLRAISGRSPSGRRHQQFRQPCRLESL